MTVPGPMLSVWAHPDDETYLAGALMAQAVRDGRRVVCVTATRGELGSTDPERWPPGDPLAEVRTKELEQALAELGVTEHVWLDYPDGGCAQVPDDEAVGRLAALLRDLEPDTVLTFGPDGMTGHDDHRAVSRWITSAVVAAGHRRPELHYATNSPEMSATLKALSPEIWASITMGGEPSLTPREELSLYLKANGELLETKARALRHQESQTQSLVAALGEDTYRALIAEEAFRRAAD